MTEYLYLVSAGLLLTCVLLAIRLIEAKKKANEYQDQWGRWEGEYWLLRSSEAIKDNAVIHLSWLPIGKDNIVKLKDSK